MKAISLWQFWASAVALRLKWNETRHWPTSYRGPLAIHAASARCSDVAEVFREPGIQEWFGPLGLKTLDDLPLGVVLCVVDLIDCVPVSPQAFYDSLSSREKVFGNYTHVPERYAWFFDNIRVLAEPIPARGRQRIWNWDRELESLIFKDEPIIRRADVPGCGIAVQTQHDLALVP